MLLVALYIFATLALYITRVRRIASRIQTLKARPRVVEKILEKESSEGWSMTVPLNLDANLLDKLGWVPDSKVAAHTNEIFSSSFFWPVKQSYLGPML
jgi:hypothetical protein